MTSRERIRCTLEHEQPDRVAIDFGGHRSSGIAAIAYARLVDKCHIHRGSTKTYP